MKKDETITFTPASQHEGAVQLSQQKKLALAKKQPTKFNYIANNSKRIGKCRPIQYPEQEAFVIQQSMDAWD